VTGDADAIARVRTQDNADLERVIMEIQKEGPVERTRSQVVLSQLVGRLPGAGADRLRRR
jgi:DNA-binding Lrp family transcriptional regulator